MRNYLCWRPAEAHEVVNIDADAVPDHVFWAVDSEVPLPFREGEGATPSLVDTEGLISRLLDRRRGHYQLAVLGPAGAGKSHLVHRLRQRLRDTPELELLSIRRLETNLRAVLDRLVDRLAPERRAAYREELDRAGPSLANPQVQMATLLDSLARVIQDDRVNPESGIDPELEAELIARLPDLLGDPYLRREKFLKPGEIVPELVERLFSNRSGKRLEERVRFAAANLPIDGVDLQKCSAPARDAIIEVLYLAPEITTPAALDVINRNLDRAIALSLNFSGDRLGQLMGEMRRHLKGQQKELVILFEEFARLQGYDSAMLAALLVQGDDELCNVRWVVACTSGRFAELPDTVRSRMNGIVDMEADRVPKDLPGFAGRYLNAARIGRAALAAEYAKPGTEVPNACDNCDYRTHCHDNFGRTGDGFGLYPFTAGAVDTMARRADEAAFDRFNPRAFQRRVLQPVLIDGGDAIAADAFPPEGLLARLGGSRFDPGDRLALQESAGRDFGRYLALFQLWNAGRLANLPQGLVEAFGLSPLAGLAAGRGGAKAPVDGPPGGAADDPRPPAPQPSRETKRTQKNRQITAWIEGGILDQNLAQELREAVYDVVEQAIDWDALGLLPTTFAGAKANRPFRVQSVNFVRQATTGGMGGRTVPLELPLRRDDIGFASCARALQALLMYRETGSWEEDEGLNGLAAVLDLAEAGAAHVVARIRELRGDTENWDPVAGAVELLLIGSALSGQLTASNSDDTELVNIVFAPAGEDCPLSDAGVQGLHKKLKAGRTKMQDLVRAHVGGAKGGARGRFIDPSEVVNTLRRFRRQKWSLSRTPEGRPEPYREVGDIYATVLADLRPALERERTARARWLERMDNAFGPETDKQAILAAVTACLDSVTAAGLPVHRAKLDAAHAAFTPVHYRAALDAARRLAAADPPESELPAFARARRSAVDAAAQLIDAWEEYLTRLEGEVAAKRREFGGDEVAAEASRLRGALAEIADELEAMGPSDVAA